MAAFTLDLKNRTLNPIDNLLCAFHYENSATNPSANSSEDLYFQKFLVDRQGSDERGS